METANRYDRLDAEHLLRTIEAVAGRIGSEFPARGLRRVGVRLAAVARDIDQGAHVVRRSWWGLRILIALGLLAIGAAFVAALGYTHVEMVADASALDFIQGLEAFFNAVFLFLAAIFSIATVEERLKRRKALGDLHRVRSIAHVIDMHQLAKDPQWDARNGDAEEPRELVRYLEYCTDLLNLTGKIAALYAQDMDDLVIVETVNDIELLSTNLSRKIWQKIEITRHEAGHGAA